MNKIEEVTHTNVRLGPGIYLALKNLSEVSGISMGTFANFFIASSWMAGENNLMSKLPSEIQTAIVADIASSIGDFMKTMGMAMMRNTSISDLYEKLRSSQNDQ